MSRLTAFLVSMHLAYDHVLELVMQYDFPAWLDSLLGLCKPQILKCTCLTDGLFDK